ncbi:MAG TPA: hypothetical protein VF597_02300 [Candidatus Saccharimonadales bacterium]|jgi:hypothetical protein
MTPNLSGFRTIIGRHRIIYAIILAIIIAVLLTVISMALYVSSGASRLDLSRPGYEAVRNEVSQTPVNDSFSGNGPINSSVAGTFQKRLNAHRDALSKLGDFESAALSDEQLQLAP